MYSRKLVKRLVKKLINNWWRFFLYGHWLGALILGLIWPISNCLAQTTELPQLLYQTDFSTNLDDWQLVRGQDAWSIQDQALIGYLAQPFELSELELKTNYWPAPANYLLVFDYTLLAGQDVNWSFGVASSADWWEGHLFGPWLHLVKVSHGQEIISFFRPLTITAGQTYQIKIGYQSGQIQIWVNDLLVASQQDYLFQPGWQRPTIKITTGASYPTQVKIDNLRWSQLPALPTSQALINLWLQTDSRWQNQEYDRASQWVLAGQADTIGAWGCALTSLVMIFDYYGLQTLPDGQPLTPASLNTWLQQQADGYVGPGWLNWQAGIRLARQIAAQAPVANSLPQLGLSRLVESDLLSEVVDNLRQWRPIIVNLPGHFVVASGWDESHQQLLMADPARGQVSLDPDQTQLLSGIKYLPGGQARGLLFLTEPAVLLKLFDKSGQQQPLLSFQETILPWWSNFWLNEVAPDNLANQKSRLAAMSGLAVYAQSITPPALASTLNWPKVWWTNELETGSYQLIVSNQSNTVNQISWYAYDDQADERHFVEQIWLPEAEPPSSTPDLVSTTINFNYDHQDLSQFQPSSPVVVDWLAVGAELVNLMTQDQLSPYWASWWQAAVETGFTAYQGDNSLVGHRLAQCLLGWLETQFGTQIPLAWQPMANLLMGN